MTVTVILVLGCNLGTLRGGVGATGMEAASARRIRRRGNISLENDSVHLFVGVGVGDRGEERLGVGVKGILEDLLLRTELNHLTEVHNSDFVRDELNYRQIVRNEEVGEVHRLLQILQKIDDLCLNGNVKRGNGLIADDKLRINGKRSRYADTLSLSVGELYYQVQHF